jgi:hypothetical protein
MPYSISSSKSLIIDGDADHILTRDAGQLPQTRREASIVNFLVPAIASFNKSCIMSCQAFEQPAPTICLVAVLPTHRKQ